MNPWGKYTQGERISQTMWPRRLPELLLFESENRYGLFAEWNTPKPPQSPPAMVHPSSSPTNYQTDVWLKSGPHWLEQLSVKCLILPPVWFGYTTSNTAGGKLLGIYQWIILWGYTQSVQNMRNTFLTHLNRRAWHLLPFPDQRHLNIFSYSFTLWMAHIHLTCDLTGDINKG